MLERITFRAARCRTLLRCARLGPTTKQQYGQQASRSFFLLRNTARNDNAYDSLNVERLVRERRDYEHTRVIFLAFGTGAGLIAMAYTGWRIKELLEQHPKRLDAGAPSSLSSGDTPLSRKVIVHDKNGNEIVPTGNSTVPEFPRTIDLADNVVQGNPPRVSTSGSASTTEYVLVGLGTRTVSFLGIQVYVVGFYIAASDIASLQHSLIKRVNEIATTLVQGEKDELRAALLDPGEGEAIWETLLEKGIPARSLFRIVPVRDTDFHHLRDGFVRAIQARAPKILEKEQARAGQSEQAVSGEPGPEFGDSMRIFRQAFNRGKAPKQRELMLVRNEGGRLSVIYDDGRSFGRQNLGSVDDERLSRALWLNYLCGHKVASEPARQSIVDGMIEFVQRPVGTVATQVL